MTDTMLGAELNLKEIGNSFKFSLARAKIGKLLLPDGAEELVRFGLPEEVLPPGNEPQRMTVQVMEALQCSEFYAQLSTACMEDGRAREGMDFLVAHRDARREAYKQHLTSEHNRFLLHSDLFAQKKTRKQLTKAASKPDSYAMHSAQEERHDSERESWLNIVRNGFQYIRLNFQKFYFNYGKNPWKIVKLIAALCVLVFVYHLTVDKMGLWESTLSSLKALALPVSVLIPGLQNILSLKPATNSTQWIFHGQTILISIMLVHFFSIKFPEFNAKAKIKKLKIGGPKGKK